MTSILDAIGLHARQQPHAAALTDGRTALSYSQSAGAGTLAGDLAGRWDGASPVGLRVDNSPAWVLFDLALGKLNIPCVPLPDFSPRHSDLRHFVMLERKFLILDIADDSQKEQSFLRLFGLPFDLHRLRNPTVKLS